MHIDFRVLKVKVILTYSVHILLQCELSNFQPRDFISGCLILLGTVLLNSLIEKP